MRMLLAHVVYFLVLPFMILWALLQFGWDVQLSVKMVLAVDVFLFVAPFVISIGTGMALSRLRIKAKEYDNGSS